MSGLGGGVRSERLRQKLTLAQVADRAGLSASALSQIERGVTDPSIGSLRRIAAALHVPFAQLMLEPDIADPVVRVSQRCTTMLILQGSVAVEVEGVAYALCAGDSISIQRHAPHRVLNQGRDTAEVLLVISPADSI